MDRSNNSSLFSGMEGLGFDNISKMSIYEKAEDNTNTKKDSQSKSENDNIANFIYEREIICPVCKSKIKVLATKTSAARMVSKDSDFYIRYAVVNPYFYDVWLCNSCGYTAMKKDFEIIKDFQREKVIKEITSKWRGKEYPDIYTADIAIERYKLSLLNSIVIEAKTSRKAMTCLKTAWMYREIKDEANEQLFLKQALEGFSTAYMSEDFPMYGMDRFTTMYLIGELNRRVGNNDEAMQWFSKVITDSASSQKLKDMARDQKDLIKEIENEKEALKENTEAESDTPKKAGFFSFILGKNKDK